MPDWRSALRAFLADHVGQPLAAGDLFHQFGAEMPLHDATRAWTRRGKQLGTPPHEHMRWAAFGRALRRLNITFDPPPSRTSPLTKTTRVTAGSAADERGKGLCSGICRDSAPMPRPTIEPAHPFWACARTLSGREAYASQHVERAGFEVFAPITTTGALFRGICSSWSATAGGYSSRPSESSA